jgi:hypothetical protein
MFKPRWCLGMLGTRRHQFGNVLGHVKGVTDLGSLSEWTATQFDPTLNWGDVEWIKKRWGGKLILKGIMDAEDAKLAVDSGADALIVSNHGGRQLDGATSSIEALPAIVAEVGRKLRFIWTAASVRGQDVLKAVALGARGTYIGRAFLYGLGAMGEAGVTKALEIIHTELDLTMAFCGHTAIGASIAAFYCPAAIQSERRAAGAAAISVGRRQICSAHEQHRHTRRAHDVLGVRAHDEPANPTAAMSADHDQIRGPLFRVLGDRRSHRPHRRFDGFGVSRDTLFARAGDRFIEDRLSVLAQFLEQLARFHEPMTTLGDQIIVDDM